MLNHYRLGPLKEIPADYSDWYKVEVQDESGDSLGYVISVESKDNEGDCVLIVDEHSDEAGYIREVQNLEDRIQDLEDELWEYKHALSESEEQLQSYREDKE